MKTAIVRLENRGEATAARIVSALGADVFVNETKGGLPDLVARLFAEYDGLVFLMATGIVVRLIAPHLADKYHDPAVVVVDDAERFAVSLLSGHEGGANRLAARVAAAINAEPVVTTATDTNRRIVIGVGCRRGVTADAVVTAVDAALAECGASREEVRTAATIEAKREEGGLSSAFSDLDIPLRYVAHHRINDFCGDFASSEAPMRHVGVKAVAEPCALLVGRNATLILRRRAVGPVTVAVALEDTDPRSAAGNSPTGAAANEAENPSSRQRLPGAAAQAALTIVGIGPGDASLLTPMARHAIEACELVVGYTRYLELLGDLIAGKEQFTSGMRRETERARYAVDHAHAGRRVCVVSSGDAGVYGLAGLVLELLAASGEPWPTLRVVPGVTAANAAASLLGAPLMHDHAVISLSDLLTPWETILDRVRHAAEADLAIALYNPKSRRRTEHLELARAMIAEYRDGSTPVGVVTSAYRDDCATHITTLDALPALYDDVGMSTIVVIGNSSSYVKNGMFITPRGYRLAGGQEQ